MSAETLVGDREYCRAILPRVSRTFAINIRLLRGPMGEAVRIAYLLCRASDVLEDSWPGDAAAIGRRFELLMSALAGDEPAADALSRRARAATGLGADLELVTGLPRIVRVFRTLPAEDRALVTEGVQTLARGMCRYATRAAVRPELGLAAPAYLDNVRELHDYCWIVAGCIGVMLTRLYGLHSGAKEGAIEARRLELAPVVGEALQLTNILLDWPTDIRRGRCYVPADWLTSSGISPADLISGPNPAAQEIATRIEWLARSSLARVPDYIETIPAHHVRYRLFCLWPALWALRSLKHARRDAEFPWGPERPRLPRGELWRSALGSLVAGHHTQTLRSFYAAHG